MTFPSERKQNIIEALKFLDFSKQAKFGAWCMYYFETEPELVKFFEAEMGGEAKERVSNLARKLWFSELDVAGLEDEVEFLESFDWDSEAVSETDYNSSQGLIDYLAAGTFAAKHAITKDSHLLYSCSENVLNRIDYLLDFGQLDADGDVVESEYRRQIAFLKRIHTEALEIDWSR